MELNLFSFYINGEFYDGKVGDGVGLDGILHAVIAKFVPASFFCQCNGFPTAAGFYWDPVHG